MTAMKKSFQYFRQAVTDLIRVWQKETYIIFHDGGLLIFCILVPLGYPLLYTWIYNTELMRDVPITVVDQDRSSMSREFIRRVDASQWTRVRGVAADIPEAKQEVKEQRTYGFLVIPKDFSSNIVDGKQSFVGMYSDMGGLLYYKGILIAATDVSMAMNRNIKIAEAGKTTGKEESVAAYPVTNEEVTLFNSQQGFASFLIPAVLMLILQQTLLLGIGMAGGTAAEDPGRYSELIATSRKNSGTIRILLGRALAYFLVYSVMAAYIVCVVPRLFNLTQLSHPLDLMLFLLPYILACIFFSLSLSVLMRNREMSILIIVVTSVPLLFISGISWPESAIPPFLKGVSWIFPSTFGINGFARINTMGARLSQVLPEWYMLWLQTIIYFVSAYIVCRALIRFDDRHSMKARK